MSPRGEDEDPDVLRQSLGRSIKGGEVFIPASISTVGDSRVIHRLVDGYVFIRRTLPDSAFFKVEQTKYIESVLTVLSSERGRSTRKLACVQNSDVEKMRKQVHIESDAGIQIGDEVQVTSGAYRGINGRVIEEIPENDTVQVFIKLRSKEAIVTLPRSFLKFVAKDATDLPNFSPFATKIARIRDWLGRVAPIFQWRPGAIGELKAKHNSFSNIVRFSRGFERASGFIKAFSFKPDVASIQEKNSKVNQLNTWQRRGTRLFKEARAGTAKPQTLVPIESKLLEVQWLQGAVQRLVQLNGDVDEIEKSLTANAPDMIDNVIVDGHNLAYRVHHALNAFAAKPFTDSKGRPTAIVYGVLRALGSFQKKFPEAQVWVVWDGSPQRRKIQYAEYKANRPPRVIDAGGGSFNQIDYLNKILPLLGVNQAHHPDEETDDIIACLVRGPLKGQRNVIISTDHDFLQLVTTTDIVLVPKVGNRQEVLYDRDKVVEEYGVAPDHLVQLRALMGSADTSDNLKGVPRVPTKVLTALLNVHGSVDAIYASNLSGVTPNQYEKIRAHEKQVKLNVVLMTLLTDLSYTLNKASPDPEEGTRLLADLDIQAEPILKSFFREIKGFNKHS